MRLGQTSAAYFIFRAVASLLGFGATLYLAYLLSPVPLGVYGLKLSLFAWLTNVGEAGITEAVIKRVSEGGDRSRYIVAGVAAMVLPTCLAVGGVLIPCGPVDAYVGYPVVDYFPVILVTVLAAQVVGSTIHGIHLVEIEGLLLPLQSGVQTALLTIGLGMVGMFVGYAVGALAVVTVGAVVAWRHLPPLRLPDRSHVRDLVSYAKFA